MPTPPFSGLEKRVGFALTPALLYVLPDEWTMFDDDKVSAVESEDILKLSGGGKWPMEW